MSTAKWIKVAITVAVISGAASLWMVQRQTQIRLRAENQSLHRQLERMAQLETDNAQLSNIVAHADGSRPNQQLMELLRLRNEVGMLRRQTNELQKLRELGERLQAAIQAGNAAQASQNTNSPSTAKPLAVYPKASWAFAGYATPEDAIQSLIWAAANGNLETMRASLTSEMQKDFAKQFNDKSESEVAGDLKNQHNKSTEVRILTKDQVTDDLVVLGVSDDEQVAGVANSPTKLVFQRIDGQWKLASGH